MKRKLKEWLNRYLPANLISLFLTILTFYTTLQITNNTILASLAGAIIGDNLGYYGTIFIRDLLINYKNLHNNQTRSYRLFLKTLRNMVIEFGPAEILDSYLIRPLALYLCPLIIGQQIIGLIIGKYLADIIFYLPTITAYELRKKYLS